MLRVTEKHDCVCSFDPKPKDLERFWVKALYLGIIGTILVLYRDNGKEDGNYYNGFYRV